MEKLYKTILAEKQQLIEEIDSLLCGFRNQNDKVRISSVKNAKKWGIKIYNVMVKNSYEWRKPFVNVDEEGNVVLEWWYEDRNLTLDISGNKIIFSETRDADSSPQITMGKLVDRNLLAKLKWLILDT